MSLDAPAAAVNDGESSYEDAKSSLDERNAAGGKKQGTGALKQTQSYQSNQASDGATAVPTPPGTHDKDNPLDLKSTQSSNDSSNEKSNWKSGVDDENENRTKSDSSRSDNSIKVSEKKDLEANTAGSSDTLHTDKEEDKAIADPNIVDWDGPDDPKNPMNWPAWKINAHIFLISAITFIR